MGLTLLAVDPQRASNTVTAIMMPEGIEFKALNKKLREQDAVVIASGQDHMAGKIFRVGHLGFFTEGDLEQAMNAIETRLHELGFKG